MTGATEALIGQLAAELRPVRRLPRPWLRAALWLGCLGLGAVALAMVSDVRVVLARLTAAPEMWMAAVGSVATAVLAALAACLLSVPGYSRHWAWLPLPGVLLWLGSSGLGCLRGVALATLHGGRWDALTLCVPFILKTSVALAIPMAVLLWWARPLRPGLVALQGGLAVAAGSASLLWFIHPFDASYEDLLIHLTAIAAVVLICRLVAFIPSAGPRRAG